jgi:hypothetical protein
VRRRCRAATTFTEHEIKAHIAANSTQDPPALVRIAMINCAHRHLVAGAFKAARHLADVRHRFLAWRRGSAEMYKICTRPPQVRRR